LLPQKIIQLEPVVTLFLIAALALGSFAPAWYTGSLHKKVNVKQPWAMIFTSAGINTLFFTIGYLPIQALGRYMPEYACLAGQFIVLIIGLKLIIEAIRFNPEEKIILVDDSNALILVGLARGINYLMIGLGLGFCGNFNPNFLYIIFAAEAIAIYSGLILGHRIGLKAIIRTLFLISGIAILAVATRSIILQF
jgi:putative Mn2+ efflux pump MntP